VTRPAAPALVAALLLAVAAGACSSGTSTATGGGAVSSTAATGAGDGSGSDTTELKKVFKQDQTDIRIGTGETFAIRLPADPSTGSGWTMVSAPDDSFVKADGSSFKADPNAPPGAPGQIEFKFKAKKPGPTTVTFVSCDGCGDAGSSASMPAGTTPQRLTFTITVG
jgi:predicted secreted protein